MGNRGGKLSKVVPVHDDDEPTKSKPSSEKAAKAVAAKQTSKDGKHCLVVVGNPGAGKSTVLNSLIGEAKFLCGFSPGRGLTSKVDSYEHQGVLYIDTPGLADTKLREKAANAITEALARESDYRILFMVTVEGWNFRPQDKATVELVLEAIEGVDLKDKYAVVANKVSKDLPEEEAAERLQRMATDFFKGIVPTKHVTWLMETEMDEDDELLDLPESFLSFIEQVPKVFIKKECVAQVKWNKFEERRLKYLQEIAELEKTQRDLRQQLLDLSKGGSGKGRDESAEKGDDDAGDAADLTCHKEFTKGDNLVILEEVKLGAEVLKSGSRGKVVGWDSESEILELQCDGLKTAAKIPRDQFHHFCRVADVGSLRRNKVRELASRGLTLESLLDFYVKLSEGSLPMTDFDPMKSTTAEVVSKAIIPETKRHAKSYAEVVHPRGKLAMRMVTHNWGNVFTHLIAAIVADALDMPHFSEILDDLKPSAIEGLMVHLKKLQKLGIVYWVCAFSVNQHRSICKQKWLQCTCTSTNIDNDSPLCEMDKFDDMMDFIFNNQRGGTVEVDAAPRHVVAVDSKHAIFTRAWVVAELVIALCMDTEPEQKYRVVDESSLKRCLESTHRKGIDTRKCEASHPPDKELVLKKTEEHIKKCGYDWVDLHAKLNGRIFERLNETHTEVKKSQFLHVLCIGNAGVGKSTILNMMIGKPLFPVRGGGEPQPALCEHVDNDTIFMEALGLADLQLREKTAEAITTALKKEGRYKIFFVVTLESGRVRPEDTEMIHRVLEAAPAIGSEYNVIINKILLKEARELANPRTLKAIRSELFVALDPPLEPTDDVSWVEKGGKLPRGLLRDAPELILGRGMVRSVDAETDEQKAEKAAARKSQLEKDTVILKESLAAAREQASSRRVNDEGAEVALGTGKHAHKYYCGRPSCAGSKLDKACGPDGGPQCQSCQRFQGLGENDEGAPVAFGRDDCAHKHYCGRNLGKDAIPGSDGRCGPGTGPQCKSCQRHQGLGSNDEGAPVAFGRGECAHKHYCGRTLGRDAIPDSDGSCGPGNGPQCKSCQRHQGLGTNDEDAPVAFGRGECAHKIYCGRNLGREAVPGSDGRCGPGTGPQCQSCKRRQDLGANDEGAQVFYGSGSSAKNYYCGRTFGGGGAQKAPAKKKSAAASSASHTCGPKTGPQCPSCKRLQTARS